MQKSEACLFWSKFIIETIQETLVWAQEKHIFEIHMYHYKYLLMYPVIPNWASIIYPWICGFYKRHTKSNLYRVTHIARDHVVFLNLFSWPYFKGTNSEGEQGYWVRRLQLWLDSELVCKEKGLMENMPQCQPCVSFYTSFLQVLKKYDWC